MIYPTKKCLKLFKTKYFQTNFCIFPFQAFRIRPVSQNGHPIFATDTVKLTLPFFTKSCFLQMDQITDTAAANPESLARALNGVEVSP